MSNANSNKKNTVLVTGGAGFIGSHIVDRLLKKGYWVKILDNLESRVHPKGAPDYIPEEATFIQGDLTSEKDLKKALKDVNVIFHEAAYQDYMPDYSKFMNTNVKGTSLIYELIRKNDYPVKKIIVASSQAVYGEGQYECKKHGFVQPVSRPNSQLKKGEWEVKCPECGQEMQPLKLKEEHTNPYNQYALSKYSEEMISLRLGKLLDIPTVALRYSITQGPRQSLYNQYSGICRIFSLRLLNDKAPIAFEDGKQQRDYVHVEDVVDANMLVLDKEKANYEAYNVGSGKATTVLEYAKLLAEKLDKNIKPKIPGEYRAGDNRHSVSSIEKLKSLGWKPEKDLNDILEDYINWIGDKEKMIDYFDKAQKSMREQNIIKEVED